MRFAFVVTVLATVASAQQTLLVPSQYSTIQAAINSAANADTVLVSPGTYVESIDFLGKAIHVVSSNGESATTITGSGGSVVRFVGGEGPASTLEGFTITGGQGTNWGGGIRCIHGSPTIRSCRIIANTVTDDGGGIYCRFADSSPTIESCTIENNAAVNGGGIYACCDAAPIVVSCSINANLASNRGGGIFLNDASPAISDTTIELNNAHHGGGIAVLDAAPSLISTTIRLNQSAQTVTSGEATAFGAGVIVLGASSPTFVSCVISENTATATSQGGDDANAFGAGLYVAENSTASLSGCTISANACLGTHLNGGQDARGFGGGVFTIDYARVLIVNSSLQFNTAIGTAVNGSGKTSGGGGLFESHVTSELKNCLINGNTISSTDPAAARGAGIATQFYPAAASLLNVTIAANYCNNAPSSISSNSAGIAVTNSILRGSVETVGNASISVAYSNVTGGWSGPTNFDADPLFVDPVVNDFHLSATSPCIDSGSTAAASGLLLDLDGDPRVLGNAVDIGADEFSSGPSLGPPGTGNVGAGLGGPFDVLTVNGSSGVPARRVDVAVNAPITISISQPPTSSSPAAFVLYGFIGVPAPTDAVALPLGIGTMAFIPYTLNPAYPGAFQVASSFQPDPVSLVAGTLTPWSYTKVTGIHFPFQMTFQAVMLQYPVTFEVTNGVILNVQ